MSLAEPDMKALFHEYYETPNSPSKLTAMRDGWKLEETWNNDWPWPPCVVCGKDSEIWTQELGYRCRKCEASGSPTPMRPSPS